LLTACGSVIHPITLSGADIYLAGFAEGPTNEMAMYWKNGVGIALTDQTVGALAEGIAVSGNDVYVVGNMRGSGHQLAMLWKNGVAIPLTDGTKDGNASSVYLSGSDVYVAGSEIGFDPSGNFYSVAEYWKNGVPTILTDTTTGAMAMSIFVSGTDVYVAGYENKTTQTGPSRFFSTQVAHYWKNGAPVDLTDGTTGAVAFSIFVSGSDVYVAGYNCLTTASGCERAAYWKTGTLVQLTIVNDSTAPSIFAAGGNVYAADNEVVPSNSYDEAALWVDGQETILGVDGIIAANAVVVSGNDVYVGGALGFGAGFFKNGNFAGVANDGNEPSSAFAIAVVPH